MVSFLCDNCGKCCTSLGSYISIERQLSERDYYCKNGITGEIFRVHVQDEFTGEIEDDFGLSGPGVRGHQEKCVFLRKNPFGPGWICAVYTTRPRTCRDFRCYHAVILNNTGEIVGRIIGKTDVKTADPVLAGIWRDEVKPCFQTGHTCSQENPGRVSPGESDWMEKTDVILKLHHYRIERIT